MDRVLESAIAERDRAKHELESERFLLRTLMDTIPDHIYFKDRQSRFVRINKAMAEWTGFATPDDALGKTDFVCSPRNTRAKPTRTNSE